jgi:hypothetical protein
MLFVIDERARRPKIHQYFPTPLNRNSPRNARKAGTVKLPTSEVEKRTTAGGNASHRIIGPQVLQMSMATIILR